MEENPNVSTSSQAGWIIEYLLSIELSTEVAERVDTIISVLTQLVSRTELQSPHIEGRLILRALKRCVNDLPNGEVVNRTVLQLLTRLDQIVGRDVPQGDILKQVKTEIVLSELRHASRTQTAVQDALKQCFPEPLSLSAEDKQRYDELLTLSSDGPKRDLPALYPQGLVRKGLHAYIDKVKKCFPPPFLQVVEDAVNDNTFPSHTSTYARSSATAISLNRGAAETTRVPVSCGIDPAARQGNERTAQQEQAVGGITSAAIRNASTVGNEVEGQLNTSHSPRIPISPAAETVVGPNSDRPTQHNLPQPNIVDDLARERKQLQQQGEDPFPEALQSAAVIQGAFASHGIDLQPASPIAADIKMPTQHPNICITKRKASAATIEWELDAQAGVSPQIVKETCNSLVLVGGFEANTPEGSLPLPPQLPQIATPIHYSPLGNSRHGNGVPSCSSNKQRRKNHRWEPDETAAFKEIVERIGVGQWKAVRQEGVKLGVLHETRSEVDLKDKWRNICKHHRS